MPRVPDVFILTARCPNDPQNIVVEKFFRSIYEHDADRYVEASSFAEKMHAAGYFVEYSEAEEISRV